MSDHRDHELEQASEVRKNHLLAVVMVLALVCLVTVLFFAFRENRKFNDRLCEQANDSREVLRNVLLLSASQEQRGSFPAVIRAEDGSERKVTITFPDFGQNNREFVRAALVLVEPVEC